MNTNTATETSSHPFTRAGLGQAPFRYIGERSQDLRYGQAVVGRLSNGAEITTKPGGTCAYCGTYIVNMFNVESADGNKFHVGSDCVAKIASADPELASVVERAVSKARKVQTDARNAAKIAELDAALKNPEVLAVLKSKPHPSNFSNKTLLDFVHWMLNHAGTAGKLKTAKVVALALAPAGSCRYCGKPEACGVEKPCKALRAVWAREERRVQRCENEEARRFEERAYGRD